MQDEGDGPAAGGSPLEHPPAGEPGSSGIAIRDPRRLLRPAKVLILLGLGLAVMGVGSDVLEMRFFYKIQDFAFATDAEMMAAAESNDLRQLIIAVPYLIVIVLAFIFVGRWIYYSAVNVRAFGATGLKIRPGWAVGWYFIPIANLWKPYQAMKEIWQASSEPLDWQNRPVPGLMPAWWTLWIVSNIADRVTFRLASDAATLDQFKFATFISIGSGCLNIALSVVFIMLIARITDLQIDAAERKTTVAVFGP